jgi:endonuclease/exonuclease/phosphatase family metal-dependent hydrolase
MRFTFLTYNTCFNHGFLAIDKIIKKYQPDIICVQEVETTEENLKLVESYGYKLADFSNSFIKSGKIFGVATFYNSSRFSVIKNSYLIFFPNLFDRILSLIFNFLANTKEKRTVLENTLYDSLTKKNITIYNNHFPVLTTNGAKIKALKDLFDYYQIKNKKITIIAGDFNYLPYGRRRLEKLIYQYGLKEATKTIFYTIIYSLKNKKVIRTYPFIGRIATKIFSWFFTDRLKIDYIFYKGLKLKKTRRINVDFSDHYPILSIFDYE